MSQLLVWMAVAAVSTGVIWKGSDWLEQSSETLAKYYGLPAVVQGAVIAAIGSSFPELSSTVISTLVHGKFNLGVGAIVGSAIFNILVIPALSGVLGGGLDSNQDIAYKENQFYIIAIAWLVITFGLAVLLNPTPDGRLTGNITRGLAIVPIIVYVLYIFVQYHYTADADTEAVTDGVNALRQWGLLLLSLVTIAVAVEGLVKSAIHMGDIFGTPDFLWGMTVIAAGTSLPDALVSIRKARDGEGVTSLANVFGSNTFDLLVAVPAGVLIAGKATVDFGAALPMFTVLTAATYIIFVFLVTDLELTKRESYSLLLSYLVFLVWLVLETMGIANFLPTT